MPGDAGGGGYQQLSSLGKRLEEEVDKKVPNKEILWNQPVNARELEENTEPEVLNFSGDQESIPRNKFCQPMYLDDPILLGSYPP